MARGRELNRHFPLKIVLILGGRAVKVVRVMWGYQRTLSVEEGIAVRLISSLTRLDSVVFVHTINNIFSGLVKSNFVN